MDIFPIRFAGLIWCIVLLTGGFAGCSNTPKQGNETQPPETKYVLSAGDLTLLNVHSMMDSSEVAAVMGPPDSVSPMRDSENSRFEGFVIWHYHKNVIYFGPSKSVEGVQVMESGIATNRGLNVGDTLPRVRELYGRAIQDYDYPDAQLAYRIGENAGMGIVFDIREYKVSGIYAGRLFGGGEE